MSATAICGGRSTSTGTRSGLPRATATSSCGSSPTWTWSSSSPTTRGNVGDPDRRQVNDHDLVRCAILPLAARPATRRPALRRPWGRHNAAERDRPCPAARLAGRRPRVVVVARRLPDRAGVGRARSQRAIYTASADGTDLRRLTRDLAFDNLPAWSPDGNTDRLRPGQPRDQRPVPRRPRRVRAPAADRLRRVRERAHVVARRQPHRVRVGPHRGEGLRSGRAAVGDGRRWVRDDAAARSRRRVPRRGHRTAARSPSSSPATLSGIGVLDLETRALTELQPGFAPRWSPDGRRIAFIAGADGATDIFTMDPDGRARDPADRR